MKTNYNIRFNQVVLICLVCFLSLFGCTTTQYEKVAKEWCTAIRANQMIPVYPLNQDVRPGDVYLVQSAIADETSTYNDKGFLTLDDLRTRLKLEPETFNVIYFSGYFKTEGKPPFDYPKLTSTSKESTPDSPAHAPTAPSVIPTPRAAFPSYSFTIKSGEGLSLGVPISSIPVALNFLGAQETSAIVTLADASTYQADHETIMVKLKEWIDGTPQVRAELEAACRYVGKEYVYLRVIKRVYLVGAVDIALERKDTYQGGIQAGLVEQAADTSISVEKFADSIAKQAILLKELNNLAAKNKIGGAVNFNIATKRNIGLRESFDRPLVVGYLGIDVPFFQDGRIGAPIPTFERLELPSRFGDPKPIELQQLLDATKLFKAVISVPDTRQQALAAAEQFCGKVGGEAFVSLGQKAKEMNDTLRTKKSIPDESIKNFTQKLIFEINKLSTIGPQKDQNRVKLEKELRSALRNQGI
ncbi:MAG: hypothetical protein ABFD75_00310 [Smithella sp.]